VLQLLPQLPELGAGGGAVGLQLLRAPHLPARAGNRRKGRLSALRAHTKAPYKMDLHRKTLSSAKAA
jgi:hypothetical protein